MGPASPAASTAEFPAATTAELPAAAAAAAARLPELPELWQFPAVPAGAGVCSPAGLRWEGLLSLCWRPMVPSTLPSTIPGITRLVSPWYLTHHYSCHSTNMEYTRLSY